MIRKVAVLTRGRHQVVASLSGGNQQKVALAKWLSTQARVFLLDEPTAGIDVGAKKRNLRFDGGAGTKWGGNSNGLLRDPGDSVDEQAASS